MPKIYDKHDNYEISYMSYVQQVSWYKVTVDLPPAQTPINLIISNGFISTDNLFVMQESAKS